MITMTKQEALRRQAEQVARYACIYGIEVAVAVAAGTSAAALQDDVEYPVHVINRHIPRGGRDRSFDPRQTRPGGLPMRTTILDQLTTPVVTPDILRVRASYWRTVADRHVRASRVAQADRLRANCEVMERQAAALEAVPAIVARVAANGKARPAPRALIPAARFWELHSHAVNAIVALHGVDWHCRAAREHTVCVSLPPKLRSYVGPRGGTIRWGRDHRMPAAMFWPNGMLPDGLIIAPPPPAERPPHPLAVGLTDRDDPRYGAMLEAHRQAWNLVDIGGGVLITQMEYRVRLARHDQREIDERIATDRLYDKAARARRDAEKARVADMRREVELTEAALFGTKRVRS